MNIGIAFSIKSNLGSTPVVAVPYTISIISGIDVGICNMAFLCFVVLIELLLLRKAFHPKHFLQVFVGILFGAFTYISMILLSVIPPIDNLIIQIIFLILGIVILAFGLFLYVPTNVVPVPIDGLTQAVSIYANQSFAKIKVMTDITMIIISLSLSLIFHVSDITVGIGTIIAALSVGTTVKIMNMIYAKLTGKEADLKKM